MNSNAGYTNPYEHDQDDDPVYIPRNANGEPVDLVTHLRELLDRQNKQFRRAAERVKRMKQDEQIDERRWSQR